MVTLYERGTPRPVHAPLVFGYTMVDGQKSMANTNNGAMGSRRSKGKRVPDVADTSKLLEQRIAQLEQNKAGDREQELEIGKIGAVMCYVTNHQT